MSDTLYLLKQALASEGKTPLPLFEEAHFAHELQPTERLALAKLYIKQAEKQAHNEELLLATLRRVEWLVGEEPQMLCKIAKLLYEAHSVDNHLLFSALDYLRVAEKKDPEQFNSHHLSGQVLLRLGKQLNQTDYLESALDHFKKVEKKEASLHWNWGEAWTLLGTLSLEQNDFKQALEHFAEAQTLGCKELYFALDYVWAIYEYCQHLGEPALLEVGIELIQSYIEVSEEDVSDAWVWYFRLLKCRYDLTHTEEAFEEAERVCREAILAAPDQVELWLDWGELYLSAGWLHADPKRIELALDKLTASKISECDPIQVSALLGEGIAMLGVFLEDLSLIQQGSGRIRTALELAPEDLWLREAEAFCQLALALYYSEGRECMRAVARFENLVEAEPASLKGLHGLFRAYMAWGMVEQSPPLLEKGLKAIGRLSSLRPASYKLLCEWGVALLEREELEKGKEHRLALVEEAVIRFNQANDLVDSSLELTFHLGKAFLRLGQIQDNPAHFEEAMDLLGTVYAVNSIAGHPLALAHAQLGELIEHPDHLYQAIELLQPLAQAHPEDASLWDDLGFTQLALSELIFDPLHSEESESRRIEAEKNLLQAVELGSLEANYHLACLYSLAGYPDQAMTYLGRAETLDCLPHSDFLEHDHWLDPLRQNSDFQNFVSMRKEEERW